MFVPFKKKTAPGKYAPKELVIPPIFRQQMALWINTKSHCFSCSQEEAPETRRMEHSSLQLDVDLFKIYTSKVRRLGALLDEEKIK